MENKEKELQQATQETTPATNETQNNNNELEELRQQLEEAKAQLNTRNNDYTRLKASFDKTASEVSKYKKDLQAKMTEEELAKVEREEREQKNAQELNDLKGQLSTIKAMKRYTAYGLDEKACNECADAEKNGDYDKLLSILKQHNESVLKAKQQEWMNGRPEPQAGGGQPKTTSDDAFLNGFAM